MNKLNFGVIGCGGIAKNTLVPQTAAISDFKLHAFADISEAKAEELRAKYGAAYATTDASRIISDPNVDAIMICTLPDTHASLAIQALEAGKHVFIQKPVSINMAESIALARAAKNAKGIAMAAYCYRWSPIVARIREVIPQPNLIFAHMMNSDLMNSHRHYLGIPGLDHGGPMLELACHNVDMACCLANSVPVRVSAHGGNLRHPGANIIDNFAMTIEFANGAVATLLSGDCGDGDFSKKWFTEVFGDNTSAVNHGFRELVITGRVNETTTHDYGAGIGLNRDMEVFRDVLNGAPNPAPVRQSVISSVLMLKAFESMREYKVVNVNAEEIP